MPVLRPPARTAAALVAAGLLVASAPARAQQSPDAPGDSTAASTAQSNVARPYPTRYAFVRPNTRVYATAEAAARGGEDGQLFEGGWGVQVAGAETVDGVEVVRTMSGTFVRRAALRPASESTFVGGEYARLAGAEPEVPIGWVFGRGARVYPAPGGRPGRFAQRFLTVHLYETRADAAGVGYTRIGPDRWVRADAVRPVVLQPPPEGVDWQNGERWIDVNLTTQTLVVYDGATPVYATLVSTGRQGYSTPQGTFRIYRRHPRWTMDNLEHPNGASLYHYEHVPWVQFFDHGRALHGVYWHGDFGYRHSHGCVNLSPRDAGNVFRLAARRYPGPEPASATPLPAEVREGGGVLVRVWSSELGAGPPPAEDAAGGGDEP